jgi:DDE superfamily endonuclease
LTVQQHDRLLEKDEWVWGDSAYPLQKWFQAPCKKWVLPITVLKLTQAQAFSRPEKDTPENTTYNYHVSAICVCSEHCVGFLKGRWSSLKDLCLSIDGEEGLKYATYWIMACINLHTFAMNHEDGHNMSKDKFYQDEIKYQRRQKKEEQKWQRERRQRAAREEDEQEQNDDIDLLNGWIK